MMTVMKIKKYLSVLSLAAGFAAAPQIAQADGDIVDIRVMNIDGRAFGERNKASINPPPCSLENPVVAGQTICVRVRMLVPNADQVETYGNEPQTWQIKTAAGGDVLPGFGPALGLMIGQNVRWATYSLTGIDGSCQFSGELHYTDDGQQSDDYTYYTDFYFKYVVQPGDMGLPVRLIDEKLQAINETQAASLPTYGFMYINAGITGTYYLSAIDPKTTTPVATAVLKRSSEPLSNAWPGTDTPVEDYSLAKEGVYVKTVDFDTDYVSEEDDIWRELNKSGWKGNDATLEVEAGSAPTNIVVYVWSADDYVAVPVKGQCGKKIIETVVEGSVKQVLEVQIPAGETSAKFTFKAANGATVGQTVDLYMSPVLGSVYNAVGDLQETAVKRTVRVAKDSPPGVSLRIDGATMARVTADADYSVYKVKLQARVENDAGRTKELKVSINASVPGDSKLSTLNSLYNKKYLQLSSNSEGYNPTTPCVTSLTIPAPSEGNSSEPCYVYVLGASESTENDGINFVPVLEAGAEVGYTSSSNATLFVNRLGTDPGITVTSVTPKTSDDSVGTISMASTDKKQITVNFTDCYRNMTYSDDKANVYTFYLKGTEDDYEDETFAVVQATYNKSQGYCRFYLQLNQDGDDIYKVKENRSYSVELYGVASDLASETTHLKYTLKVLDGKSTTISPAGETSEIGEGETMYVKLGLNQETDSKKYIFVAGVTDKDSALFSSSLTTQGAPLGDDYQTVTSAKPIKFLNGNESGTEVNIKAILCETIDDPDDMTAGWLQGTLSVTVTNKPPIPTSLTIAGIPARLEDNGTVLESDVPMGIVKTFKLNTVDEVKADWNEGIDVKWTIDGIDYYNENAKSIADCVVNTNFTAMTTAGKKGQRVEVRLKDKDMEDYPADPNFFCYVNVVDKPSIVITTGNGNEVFDENEKNMKVVVTLSEAPKSEVKVLLRVQKVTETAKTGETVKTSKIKFVETDGVDYLEAMSQGDKDYDYYRLTYQYGVSKYLSIAWMDGTDQTNPGINMLAYVEEGQAEDIVNYYAKGSYILSVKNVPPTISVPTQEKAAITNMNASIDTPYEIDYCISDVDIDLYSNGVEVVISVDGKSVFTTNVYDKLNHKASVEFSETGSHDVELKFTDKDHDLTGYGQSIRTLYFYVKQSKVLNLRAHGPASSVGSSGGYSTKYHALSGLGQGFVFAGDSGPKKVTSFVHNYSFNLLQSSVQAYAQGYQVGDIDNGELWKGHDQWIDEEGNWNQDMKLSETTLYDYSKDSDSSKTPSSRHKGAKGLDSFVYGWACDNSEASKSSDSGTESFMLSIGLQSNVSIPLPDSESSSSSSTTEASIPVQYWEAIFSSELLKSDNCGDINGDGIPDLVMQHCLFDVLDTTGQIVGDDTRNLNYSSEDSTKLYCVESTDEDGMSDLLPTTDLAAYDSYIPGLPESWKTNGKAFTPVLKIRGFADENIPTNTVSTLNDALNGCVNAPTSDMNLGIEADQVYTNPLEDSNSTLSYVEWLAWSEYKAANPGATEKSWSPENPTDPTKADTDGDGICDGYEYWTWYMAHVGWVENFGAKNEVHKRLTGRAYDPMNPGQGKRISSETIAAKFNPNSTGDSLTRDTDNDGLPDILEVTLGTKPYDFDTDGDGLPDGWEIMIAGLDPLVPQTYANEDSDRLLNMDGDAMAISSYKLEAGQQPVSLKIEESKRWTFAVVDENGMSDGVQWYATKTEPKLAKGNALTTWYKVTVDGVEYAATERPAVTADNRLGQDTTVYTIATWAPPAAEEGEDDGGENDPPSAPILLKAEEEGERGEEVKVKGYPVMLDAGTHLDAAPEQVSEELNVFTVESDGGEAHTCWIYGAGSELAPGEVAETAAEYGCLAISRKVENFPVGAVVYAYPRDDRDVAFLHFLCYQEFGFDPRTAWNANDPLSSRWGSSVDGEALTGVHSNGRGKYTGIPARTRDYTAYDEFLVSSFFYNNAGGTLTYLVPNAAADATQIGRFWAALTTNPQGPVQNGKETDSDDDDDENYVGRNSTEGADTDGDGVPDGWELYVMAGPKNKGEYVFAPPYDGFTAAGAQGSFPESSFSPFVDSAASSDTCNPIYTAVTAEPTQLTELRKFAGTDSCNYYSTVQDGNTVAYSTTIVRPSVDEKWLNKFFPADPWTADTDNDGLTDGTESKDGSSGFIYGSPADDGKLTSIPGGGLNPLSVDTDRDGLPDGWEVQFKGTADSLYKDPEGTEDGLATYAKDENDEPIGNALQGLTDGMDGTVPDAFNYPNGVSVTFCGYAVNQVVDRDYDHDGLDNWQEYLTGTMRCWRYDDPVSPLYGIPYETYYKQNEEGKYVFDVKAAVKDLGFADENEFWGKTLVDSSSEWYNPHLVTGTSSGAQYFSRVENVWDYAYIDAEASNNSVSGSYYWFYWLGNGQPLANSWNARWKEALGIEDYDASPGMYASCSPIDPDSDHDGMDDYYEVFHGMNPLLGQSGVNGHWWSVSGSGAKNDGEGFDIVYDSLVSQSGNLPQAWGEGDSADSYKNFWQRLWEKRKESKASEEEGAEKWEGPLPRGTGYDFVFYPWLNGLATADADGDGTRNQEEAVMPLIAPNTAWHHTDPTALWMTDSSYSNSLVRTSYRMPLRTEAIELSGDGFTYGGVDYLFKDFDGFVEGSLITFNPDQWSVATTQDKMNWIASFEENEGYDSDHDGLSDSDELAGKFRGKTDALDSDSPRRRQAMYFQGAERPSILQTMPFVKEQNPDASAFNTYPDDLSFLYYTVECWVRPDTLDDATILERAMWTDQSNPADQEFIRCNFRLGIRSGKWVTKFDPNDTTKKEVVAESDIPAKAGEWTHLAATYDGSMLSLYVNGVRHGLQPSGLQPAYGSSAVAVDGMAGVHAVPGMSYWRDREYDLHAIVIGASFKNCREGAKDGSAFDVTRGTGWDAYTSFFKGYIDEIRVWDGARSASEISADMYTRYTSTEAEENREAFYNEWAKGSTVEGAYRGRYAKDASGTAYELPAELRFHWAFDSVFGAGSENVVAKVPSGFNYKGDDGNGGRAMLTRPDGYGIAWWEKVLSGYTDTIYNDKAWIAWIPNTVTHLPRYDGTTLDSRYWSEDFAGAASGTYKFDRTAEPVSFWTQYRRDGIAEGALSYSSSGSRSYFVTAYDEENNTQLTDIYKFTGRHLNQSGDDMLALGGAYVKHIDTLWDDQGPASNWEITGSDDDGDGLPDWWEKFCKREYHTEDPSWETVIVWNGTSMTAGEAYLRDLARGYHCSAAGKCDNTATDAYRQRYDVDGNGIPDWWEEIYCISGADKNADSDNDGLSNYVEFMLSEVFRFNGMLFSPINAHSADPYTLDYFYKVGQLYVGEIFTDHDQVEDAWEELYPTAFGSRLVFDAFKDDDQDGWSNRSEVRYSKTCMPTFADKQTHYSVADGLIADYPIPTLSVTLAYNGANVAAAQLAPIYVRVRSGQLSETDADAEFVIGRLDSIEAGAGSDDEKDNDKTDNTYTRTLGRWSNRHIVGTLTPGHINQNSVFLQYCPDATEQVYTWNLIVSRTYTDGSVTATSYRTMRGSRAEYDAARLRYGSENIELLEANVEYNNVGMSLRATENSSVASWIYSETGKTVGTVDMVTGAFDLDLGVFSGQMIQSPDSTNANDLVSLEDMCYRIVYSTNPSVDLPRKLYLGEADTGHVREGKNTVEAFMDIDNDGKFDPGEPYGVATDVDVSWKGTSVDIELTEQSPVTPRLTLWTGTWSATTEGGKTTSSSGTESGYSVPNDRAPTVAELYADIKANTLDNKSWKTTQPIETPTIPESGQVRVRVVRWLIDGYPAWFCGVKPTVVYDKYLSVEATQTITEDKFFADGAFDLDWEKFKTEVVDNAGMQKLGSSLTEVDYLVVIGEGDATFESRSDTNAVAALSQVLVRKFGATRATPQRVSPSATAGQIVREANPTFVWSVAENDMKGYTAFKIQVSNASGELVYDSGLRHLPPRNSAGNYEWAAPLYAGDKATNGVVYANDAKYSWKVSMYNAKYKEDSFQSTPAWYLQSVQTNGVEYGSADVAVKYFGPKKSYENKIIRVRAYESPDFTGNPVAAGYVAQPDNEDTGVAVTGKVVAANCRLIGIPSGTYYLQAFIDSNDNGICDDWESSGYLCSRDGSTAEWLTPTTVTFGTAVGRGDLSTIYIEDADTDGDSLPDAWEWAEYKSLTRHGIDLASVTDVGELVVDKSLTGDLSALPENDVNGGLAAQVMKSLSASPEMVALVTGVEIGSVEFAADGTIVAKSVVEDGTLMISDFAFDAEAKTASFNVTASVSVPGTVDSPFYSVTVQRDAVVTVRVMHTDTLAGEWTEVGSKSGVAIGEEGLSAGVVTVALPSVEAVGGFFKVVVEQ